MERKKTISVISGMFVLFFATEAIQAATFYRDLEYTAGAYPTVQYSGTEISSSSNTTGGSYISGAGGAASSSWRHSYSGSGIYTSAARVKNDNWDTGFDASAAVEFTNEYNIAASGAYNWDLSIKDSMMYFDTFTPNSSVLNAQYSIEVFANGASVWNSSAILQLSPGGHSYTRSGTDIGGIVEYDADIPIYSVIYDNYEESISLGSYAVGETLVMSYVLSVSISGNCNNPLSNCTTVAEFGKTAGGQPIGIGGIHGTLNQVSAVPLPGAVWLFGSGLLGLIGFKNRKI